MGAAFSLPQVTVDKRFATDPGDLDHWHVYHCIKLLNVFKRDLYGFAIDIETLRELLKKGVPPAADVSMAEKLWGKCVGPEDDIIYVMEMFVVILMQVRGTSSEKAKFLFDMFDLNSRGSLTHNELALLISAVSRAVVRLARSGLALQEHDVEALTDSAYVLAEKDICASLDLHAYTTWVESSLQLKLNKELELNALYPTFVQAGTMKDDVELSEEADA